jgi:hypothetical protein
VVGPAAYEGVEAAAAASWTKQRPALAPPPPRRRFETTAAPTTTAAAASALGALAAPPCCCCCWWWRLFLSLWLVSLTSRARLLLMLGQVGETASSQADMKMLKEERKRKFECQQRKRTRERDCSLLPSLSAPRSLLNARVRRGVARGRRDAREEDERNVRSGGTLAAAEKKFQENEKEREWKKSC